MSEPFDDPTPQTMITIMVAATVLGGMDGATEWHINTAFDIAERFVKIAEERYGPKPN